MTRTTELLKGCGTSDAVPYVDDYVCCGHDNGHWEEQEYQDGDHTHKEDIWVKQILLCKNCKSELRGRLDALKEEEKFLRSIDVDYITNLDTRDSIKYKLASIQEEIKLIENSI